MKYWLLLIIISFSAQGNQANAPKQFDRWDQLMKLIDEEERAIEKVKGKTDHLLYRLLELRTERVKLWKEKENKRFIELKMKYGNKVSRTESFAKTLHHYSEVEKLGQQILKQYPNTRYKAEIYFTLGLNSRDFAYDNKEKVYLSQALQYSPKGSQAEFMAKTSLAEYYYNNKQYPQAINLYQDVIKNTQDEWYTKNLYNYSWCLVKVQKFDQGIELLEKSYHLSSNPHYMNFTEQALQSLITFYVIGNRVDDGEKFIRQNEKTPFPHLFSLMKKVADRGYFKKAAELIDKLVVMIPQAQQTEVIDLKVYQIMFYKQHHEDRKLIDVARSLAVFKLEPDVLTEILEHMQQRVGLHQMTIKKDFTKYDYTYNANSLALIEDYFDTLALLDSNNKSTYEYYMAETYFAVHLFEKSLFKYSQAFENYIPEKTSKDFRQKALQAMMASVEVAKLKPQAEKDQIEYIYSNYLANWPQDDVSHKIYPKYFYLQMEQKKLDKAHQIIVGFNKHFPKEIESQRELFKQIMDYNIEIQDTLALSNNIALMAGGFLGITKEEVKKAEIILANLLFTKYQNLAQKGDRKSALAGYQSVYENKNYPQSIVADAAFNAGIMYTDMVESSNALKWYQKAYELYTPKEKQEKKSALFKLSTRMYLLQDFQHSAKLSNFMLNEFCSEKSKENTEIFYQSIRSELATDQVTNALETFQKLNRCTNGELVDLEKDMIQHFYVFNHDKTLRDFLLNSKIKKSHNDLAVSYLKKHFWRNYIDGNRLSGFILKDLEKFQCADCQVLKGQIRQLEQWQKKVRQFFHSQVKIGEDFIPEKFNKQLESRLLSAKALVDQGNVIIEFKNANITLISIQTLYELTTKLEQEIAQLELQKGEADLKNQFKKHMLALAKNFENQSRNYIKLTYKLIEESEVFQSHNMPGPAGVHVLELADIRTPASEAVATIDIIKR